MYVPQALVRRSVKGTGILGLTGAAPQTGGTTTAVTMNEVTDGTLAARVYAKATTNLLTITGKWQVLDDDDATWVDVVESNNPANVALVTGTGSAVVATKLIAAPPAVYGRRQARFLLTTGAAAGGGAGVDEFNVSYDYRLPWFA